MLEQFAYIRDLIPLSDIINRIATYVPSRRKRKLHIGLFGYSRSTGGMTLPRAITFTAALYSVGVPPELLGLSALDDDDLSFVRNLYVNFDQDLADAARYMNPGSPYLGEVVRNAADRVISYTTDEEHQEITNGILSSLKQNRAKDIQPDILRAASIRKFLG